MPSKKISKNGCKLCLWRWSVFDCAKNFHVSSDLKIVINETIKCRKKSYAFYCIPIPAESYMSVLRFAHVLKTVN